MGRALAAIYGVASYVVFLASFLYAIGFVGNLIVPRSIDSGAQAPLVEALAVNLLLLGAFGIQHSGMARRGFKQWLTRFVPASVERSTYVLISSLLLFALYWQWRAMPSPVWDLSGTLAGTILFGLFWLGWAVVLLSTFMISHFELFGLSQTLFRAVTGKTATPEFGRRAFYAFVRHPIMLGFLIAFWATPTMSQGHLLFAVVTTLYILVALQLEERDLVRDLGDEYRRYQKEVPMLLPIGGKKPST